MRNDMRNSNSSHQQAQDALASLALTPPAAFQRAIHQGKDSAYAIISTVKDSQIAIAWAVREAMDQLELGTYRLHEMTGLTCDYIDAVLEARADISDSDPISKLEQALHVPLNHL
jgi:hypothetical protein